MEGEFTKTDRKAIVAIAILSERRANKQLITYQELGDRVGLPQYGLSTLLYGVGAWCYKNKLESLALLVVTNDGYPAEGCFENPPGSTDPVTRQNYEQRRMALWRDDARWSDVVLPFDPALLHQVYVEVWHKAPADE